MAKPKPKGPNSTEVRQQDEAFEQETRQSDEQAVNTGLAALLDPQAAPQPEGQPDTQDGAPEIKLEGSDDLPEITIPPEPSPDPRAQLPPPEPVEDEIDPDLKKELDEIEPGPNAKPHTKDTIRKMRDVVERTYRTAKSEKKAKEQIEKELTALRGKVLPEEEITRLREAEKWYRTFERSKDPEIRKKYDEPAEQADQRALNLLKQWGTPPEVADMIAKRGGAVSFSRSGQPMEGGWKNTDGSAMTEGQYFDQYVMPAMSQMQVAQFAQIAGNIDELKAAKQRDIESAREQGEGLQQEQQEKYIEQIRKAVDLTVKEHLPMLKEAGLPLGLQEVPANATPEQKTYIEAQNKIWQKSEATFNALLMDPTAEGKTKAIFGAAYAEALFEKNRAARETIVTQAKRIEALEKHIRRMTHAGKTSQLNAAPPIPNENHAKQNLRTSDEEAAKAFAEGR